MRSLPLMVLFFVLTACGGTGSSTGAAATPRPSATPAKLPIAHSGPIPRMTAIGGNQPVPTANPHATPAHLPTLVAKPAATQFPASAFSVTLRGHVRDAGNGVPIADAAVIVGANLRRARTDSQGRYTVVFPAGAPVSVAVSARGYSGGLALGRVHGHQAVTVNFKLNKRAAGKSGLPAPPQLFGQP